MEIDEAREIVAGMKDDDLQAISDRRYMSSEREAALAMLVLHGRETEAWLIMIGASDNVAVGGNLSDQDVALLRALAGEPDAREEDGE